MSSRRTAAAASAAPAVSLRSVALTDVGKVRQGNEDAFYDDPKRGLFIVADGMGGHAGGEVASRLAVERVPAEVGPPTPGVRRLHALSDAIREAHRTIAASARAEPRLRGMGTTVVAAVFDGDAVGIAHVGDSRCYLFRAGKLTCLTTDQTMLTMLQREGQKLSPVMADRYSHVLSQAVGPDREPTPEISQHTIQRGDVFLLCSDGLQYIDDKLIAGLMKAGLTLDRTAEALIENANWAGGQDNVTVILVQVQ